MENYDFYVMEGHHIGLPMYATQPFHCTNSVDTFGIQSLPCTHTIEQLMIFL